MLNQSAVALRGLWRDSLRYEGACLAEAGAACEGWWSQAGSNRRPLACHASALPAELWPRRIAAPQIGVRAMTLNHSSGPISSLFVTSDITDDISDVLIALFLVGQIRLVPRSDLATCGS